MEQKKEIRLNEKQENMKFLANRIKDRLCLEIPYEDFHVDGDVFTISPYGSAGIHWKKGDGRSWIINEDDTFIVRFLPMSARLEDVGQLVEETDLTELEDIPAPDRSSSSVGIPYNLKKWEWVKEEMDIAAQYLINYNAALIAAGTNELNMYRHIFVVLGNRLVNCKK